MRALELAKELVRPYYLRWIYSPLFPARWPPHFQDCWKYPFEKIPLRRPPAPPSSGLPDLLLYPMTDWHTRLQRSQHLAAAFASLGHRCIYLNPHLGRQFETTPLLDRAHRLSRLRENIFEFHVRLPREPVFHHRRLLSGEERLVTAALRSLLRSFGTRQAAQILSFPIWTPVAARLRETCGYPLVYDCHDLLGGFGNIAPEIVAMEADLLRLCDLALFSSEHLLEHHCGRHSGLRERALLVRNAVDGRLLARSGPKPGPPVAGYVGAMEQWFDAAALREAARRNPQCRFVLVGRLEHAKLETLKSLPNVEFTGEVPHARLPALLTRFHAGLIPFLVNDLTRATNPIKLYEYFSCGIPVVSSPLPEVEAFGDLVYLASTPEEFASQVQGALAEDNPSRRERRLRIAGRETWASRAAQIAAALTRLAR